MRSATGMRPRAVSRLAWLALLGIAGVATAQWCPFRLDLTGSVPIGLYRIVPGPPVRGALVLACLPSAVARFARERGYLARGGRCAHGTVPVGKLVIAIAGDTADVTASGLVVNGTVIPRSTPLSRDSRGRPLPLVPHGRFVVPPGALWLFSPWSPRSFDGRYFGAIPRDDVRARLRALWVSENDHRARARHEHGASIGAQ